MKTHRKNAKKVVDYEPTGWFFIVLIVIWMIMFFGLWWITLNYFGYPDREGSWFQEVLEFFAIYLYIIPSMLISIIFTYGLERTISHFIKLENK